MKNRILTLLSIPLILAGCAGATAYLAQPSTQQAIVDLVSAVGSYTQGNTASTAVNLVQGATLLLRSNETTTTAPTPAALTGAVTTSMQLAKVSPSVTSAVVAAVSTMLANGATPNDAVEAAATTLYAATTTPPSSMRATIRKIIVQHHLKGAQRLVFSADN